MQIIKDFLSSSIWAGVQGLLAIVSIIIAFTEPRKWLEKRPFAKWVIQIPWVWIFVIVVVVTGALAQSFETNRFLSLFFGSVSLGLGLQWIESKRSVSQSNSELEETILNHKKLLRGLQHIVHLQQPDYKVNNWKIVHSVGESGDDLLHEELTISPFDEPIYFHVKQYKVLPDHGSPASIEVSAENIADNTPLTVLQVERSEAHIRYLILLDPPSRSSKFSRIVVKCKRTSPGKRRNIHTAVNKDR